MANPFDNVPFAPRQFVVSNDQGGFVLVLEGQAGYCLPSVPIVDQAEAERINRQVLGNSPEECRAAKAASMFGWDKYDKFLAWEARKHG